MRKVPPTFVFLPLICAGTFACAAAPQAPQALAAAPAPAAAPATRAERVAEALSTAASADQSGDTVTLLRAVRLIDASGARPLDEQADPVPLWREHAPDDRPPMRGRPLGPGYRSAMIGAGGRDKFEQLFLSGTASTIALSAPTGDRLALKVFDKDEKPVCERTAQPGACRWVPLFTQRYTIEVQNLGKADARYFLVIE